MLGGNAFGWMYPGQGYAGTTASPTPVVGGCDISLEDGTGFVLLEDGSALLRETCVDTVANGAHGHGRPFIVPQRISDDDEVIAVVIALAARKRRRKLVSV